MVTVVASKSVQTVVVNRDRTAEIERVRSEQVVSDSDRQSHSVERDTRQALATSVGLQGPRGEMGPVGPAGAQGPSGGKPGQIRFTGNGPPGVIIGAEPQDTYLDVDTGVIYRLA